MTQQPDREILAHDDSSLKRGALPVLSTGPLFWRSLEELAGTGPPAGGPALEFPDPSVEVLDDHSRRDFLRFMAASLAFGGVSGCAYQPTESIVPYVEAPEAIVPGKAMFFASAIPVDGYACGVLVKSHMGRPTNLEGNPAHPASKGAVDIFAQATILTLYDPDRSQMVTRNVRVDTWEHLQTLLLDSREKLQKTRGSGLRILTQSVTSPTLADQLRRLGEQFPAAKWHAYEPLARDAVSAGCRLAFGEDVVPVNHLDRALVIVSLDSDFLARGPGRLGDARGFATRRKVGDAGPATTMNRLYVVEPTMTLTGAAADHRLAVASGDVVLLRKQSPSS